MDRKDLTLLLQRSAVGQGARTPFCSDDDEIAGFVDGTLNQSAREHIERHLPDCQACVSRVGLLTRLVRDHAAGDGSKVAEIRTRNWKQTAPQWAVAASVILAVAYVAGTSQFTADTDPAAEYQTTRNLDSRVAGPEILAPTSGVIGKRDDLIIRWTEVPGTLYYEVHIVSDIGNLVSAQRVDGTEWRIGRHLNLESGREYFIRVDAYLTDANPISSQFIPFKLQE
jgi:hypothetical protein